jgi:uncharacterized protein
LKKNFNGDSSSMILPWSSYLIASAAALVAGFINAIAGGGTLITFPVLTALGIPPVAANVTNTIALCPGYLGGTYSQRKDLSALKNKLWQLLPVSVAGGITGGLLLLNTNEKYFRVLIPYLILLAAVLLALQVPVKKMISGRSGKTGSGIAKKTAMFVLVFLGSVYGGYFGAGLGVILMAVLGMALDDSLTKLNALKQALSLSINVTAALYFAFSGKTEWLFVLVMMAGAVAGGMIGGRMAGKIKPEILRWIVVLTGLAVATVYFFKG